MAEFVSFINLFNKHLLNIYVIKCGVKWSWEIPLGICNSREKIKIFFYWPLTSSFSHPKLYLTITYCNCNYCWKSASSFALITAIAAHLTMPFSCFNSAIGFRPLWWTRFLFISQGLSISTSYLKIYPQYM